MKTKLNLLFSLMLIAAFVLAACGGTATEAPVATEAPATEAPATEAPVVTEAPAEPVEVTFWHAYGTGSAEEVALTALLEQAAVDMPNVKINVLQVPFNDIFNKYHRRSRRWWTRHVHCPERLFG